MDELRKILESIQKRMDEREYKYDDLNQILEKINSIAINSKESEIKRSFIDTLLSIPAFDEYDSIFASFKETIYQDRMNSSKKSRSSLIGLEKEAIECLKSSNISDPLLNRDLLKYFKGVNSIQSVDSLEKKNKQRIHINYEYDSLMFDYNEYMKNGLIDGLKETQDIFGATKYVPFEIPSKQLVDQKNELDQKLNEFKRVKDLVSQNPEFASTIRSSYPSTLSKLDEYIEKYEQNVKIVNESLAKTDYKEIKEAVEKARISKSKESNLEDKNKKNILEAKKSELENLKVQANPNYARIEALEKEIAELSHEENNEKTKEEMKDEKVSEEKVTFEKSDDETLVEDADYINIRAEAIKKLDEEIPDLKEKASKTQYEIKVNEYMKKVVEERVQRRDIKDVEFELFKQDRTLTDEVSDEKFDKNDERIAEYENAASMYMEKENELFDASLKGQDKYKNIISRLESPDLDLSDYEQMLDELDEIDILTNDEKEELIDEINERKLA